MLPKKFRLHKDQDYRSVRKKGKTVYTPFFLMNYAKNDLGHNRYGFIATTKIGNAAQRHRAVRIIREAIKLNHDRISPGYDFVFVVNRKSINSTTPQVEEILLMTLKREDILFIEQ